MIGYLPGHIGFAELVNGRPIVPMFPMQFTATIHLADGRMASLGICTEPPEDIQLMSFQMSAGRGNDYLSPEDIKCPQAWLDEVLKEARKESGLDPLTGNVPPAWNFQLPSIRTRSPSDGTPHSSRP